MGHWNDENIPWLKFWTLLVTASAGVIINIYIQSFEATIELVCEIIGDNGKVPLDSILVILQHLVDMDRTIDRDDSDFFITELQKSKA